mgnify:FL=1|jgi:tRNA threonylcarbamoyl adenosine modification protein YjeE
MLANQLAAKSKIDDIYFLRGELGSGKTTFARFFIREVARLNKKKIKEPITSPTYNLINNYNCGNNINICHVDLYRMKTIKEIEKIGFFEEIENKIVLIEWPEKIEKILKKRIDILFIKKKK